MTRNYAFAGAALLVIGLFMPTVTLPIVGNVNLFGNGSNVVALMLLALAAIGAGLALTDRIGDVFWPGTASLAILLYSFVRLQLLLADMRTSLARGLAGNPFASIAQAAASSVQIQWGWIVLLLGAALMVFAGVRARRGEDRPLLSMADRTTSLIAALSVVLVIAIVGWDLHTKSSETDAATTAGSPAPAESPAGPVADTAPSAEEAAYIAKHLKIYDLEGKYYDSLMDGRVPGVDFKIKNDGDRTLNEVDVRVIFYDAQDKPIGEETYYPVLVSSSGFGDDNTPLRPNYIWKNESGKFYTAKHVPSEWAVGKVTARITKIEFGPNQQ